MAMAGVENRTSLGAARRRTSSKMEEPVPALEQLQPPTYKSVEPNPHNSGSISKSNSTASTPKMSRSSRSAKPAPLSIPARTLSMPVPMPIPTPPSTGTGTEAKAHAHGQRTPPNSHSRTHSHHHHHTTRTNSTYGSPQIPSKPITPKLSPKEKLLADVITAALLSQSRPSSMQSMVSRQEKHQHNRDRSASDAGPGARGGVAGGSGVNEKFWTRFKRRLSLGRSKSYG